MEAYIDHSNTKYFEATGQYGIDGVTEKVNSRKSIAIELHLIF